MKYEQAQPVYTSEKAERKRRQASEPAQVGYGTLMQGLLGARLSNCDLTSMKLAQLRGGYS